MSPAASAGNKGRTSLRPRASPPRHPVTAATATTTNDTPQAKATALAGSGFFVGMSDSLFSVLGVGRKSRAGPFVRKTSRTSWGRGGAPRAVALPSLAAAAAAETMAKEAAKTTRPPAHTVPREKPARPVPKKTRDWWGDGPCYCSDARGRQAKRVLRPGMVRKNQDRKGTIRHERPRLNLYIVEEIGSLASQKSTSQVMMPLTMRSN